MIWKKYQSETKLGSLHYMYYYFEFSEHVADHYYDGHQYWRIKSSGEVYNTWEPMSMKGYLQHAQRVWRVYGSAIEYVKDRLKGAQLPADEAELMLIKLAAKDLHI